jgi:rubredoxin
MSEKECEIIEKEEKVYNDRDQYTVYHTYKCSACGYKYHSNCGVCPNFDGCEPIGNYCPNCGAKIKGWK